MIFDKTLTQAMKEIDKEIMPEMPFKRYYLQIRANKKGYLGKYRGFVYENNLPIKPIIELSKGNILKAVKKYKNISLYNTILTTILHEFGHAQQELKGKEFNEEEAEQFAEDYYNFGQLNII